MESEGVARARAASEAAGAALRVGCARVRVAVVGRGRR